MKKTLIALAALASTAAFAQSSVTLSGSVAAGIQTSKTQAGVSSTGYGFDNSTLKFAVTEDLGGGMTIAADMGLQKVQYASAVQADTANLAVSGGFGKFQFNAAKESCDGVSQVAFGARLDEAGFGCAESQSDNLIYTAPSFNGLTFKVLVGDNGGSNSGAISAAPADSGVGVGNGAAKIYYVDYAAGPLTAGANLTTYQGAKAAYSNKTRAYVTYDLGVAKVGAAMRDGYALAGNEAKMTVLGLSVPMGATTVNLGYGSYESGTTGATTKKNATALNVTYALSKRTSIAADLEKVSGTGVVAATTTNFSRVLLKHAF